jgi:biopolymer transport protein ExbB
MPDGVAGVFAYPVTAVGDLVAGGGPWVVWIFLCGVTLWTIVLERYWYFSRILPREAESILAQWNRRTDRNSWLARNVRRAMISRLNVGMTANFPLLKVLVPLAPLLGLIGTVSGMLEVFDSMALRGSADARSMASGVSHAMICTMTGLAVSVTGLYPVFYFQARARRETELLADRFTL